MTRQNVVGRGLGTVHVVALRSVPFPNSGAALVTVVQDSGVKTGTSVRRGLALKRTTRGARVAECPMVALR